MKIHVKQLFIFQNVEDNKILESSNNNINKKIILCQELGKLTNVNNEYIDKNLVEESLKNNKIKEFDLKCQNNDKKEKSVNSIKFNNFSSNSNKILKKIKKLKKNANIKINKSNHKQNKSININTSNNYNFNNYIPLLQSNIQTLLNIQKINDSQAKSTNNDENNNNIIQSMLSKFFINGTSGNNIFLTNLNITNNKNQLNPDTNSFYKTKIEHNSNNIQNNNNINLINNNTYNNYTNINGNNNILTSNTNIFQDTNNSINYNEEKNADKINYKYIIKNSAQNTVGNNNNIINVNKNTYSDSPTVNSNTLINTTKSMTSLNSNNNFSTFLNENYNKSMAIPCKDNHVLYQVKDDFMVNNFNATQNLDNFFNPFDNSPRNYNNNNINSIPCIQGIQESSQKNFNLNLDVNNMFQLKNENLSYSDFFNVSKFN